MKKLEGQKKDEKPSEQCGVLGEALFFGKENKSERVAMSFPISYDNHAESDPDDSCPAAGSLERNVGPGPREQIFDCHVRVQSDTLAVNAPEKRAT